MQNFKVVISSLPASKLKYFLAQSVKLSRAIDRNQPVHEMKSAVIYCYLTRKGTHCVRYVTILCKIVRTFREFISNAARLSMLSEMWSGVLCFIMSWTCVFHPIGFKTNSYWHEFIFGHNTWKTWLLLKKTRISPSSDHDQFEFIFSEFKGVMDRKIVYVATLSFLVAQRSVIPLDKCNFPPCWNRKFYSAFIVQSLNWIFFVLYKGKWFDLTTCC